MLFETKGKVYGIFGKSGAGKSTLMSLIAGLEKLSIGATKKQIRHHYFTLYKSKTKSR